MRTNPNFREGSLLNDETHPSNKYHVLSDFFHNVLALRQKKFYYITWNHKLLSLFRGLPYFICIFELEDIVRR